MRYKTWQEFFEAHDTSYIGLDSYGGETHVSLEDLYQHFKTRMMAELPPAAANEFDPNLPQYLWSDRRRAHEGAQQQAATSRYLAK
jgi:hypothetical protein